MGSPDTEANRNSNETQYQVTLNAFRMSKHEITNAQFVSFLNAKRIRINEQYVTSSFGSQWLFYLSSGAIKYTTEWVVIAGYEAYPMINVTWYGAMEFAKFVGGRLPTEAEWEYAARAKTTQAFNTGDCLSNLNANYWWLYPQTGCTNNNSTFPYRPQPVGTYPPNAWGLYDMHGNVWEWCNDWFGTYPITSQTNPTGPNSGIARVYRGGDYLSYAQYCRSAYRSSTYPENSLSGSGLGFRVVFTP
jgi:formylglycine-generating enzyme required for sulfatase activity